MLKAFKQAVQARHPLAGTVFLTAVVLSACAYRYGIYMMLPDNFNYITYSQQLFEGSFHATSLQTPKPLLILVFGALWNVTGSPAFLIVLFIAIATLAAYGSASVVRGICGSGYDWTFLALLLPSPIFLHAVLSGYSELLSAAVIVWLIARHLKPDRVALPDRWTAVGLFMLNLIRPENWLLSAAVAMATGIAIAVGSGQTSGPGKALWKANCSLVAASFPLLAPLIWLWFDYAAFGDPLFSFKVTAHFAGVGSAVISPVHWWAYFPEAVNSIRSQVSLFVVGCAAIGVAVLCRRRPSLLILLALPFITTVAFYFVAYITGMAMYDRFFFVPVIMIFVMSCIGLAWSIKQILAAKTWPPHMPITYSSPAIGKRVLVVAGVMLVVVIEHRSLPFKISAFDTFARWRISALSAAEAVHRDSDYGPPTPVIVRVEDLALVGWALRIDGRTLIDTLTYKHEGARLLTEVLTAYFIINQPHQGKLFPDLPSGRLTGFRTNIIYDDSTTVVYKVRRISTE